MSDHDDALFQHMHGSFGPDHATQTAPETDTTITPDFDCPEGFDPAKLKRIRSFFGHAADPVIAELEAAGFTYRQACSVLAHVLLDVAWIAASTGAISEGQSPNPARFIDAARATTARLTPEAVIAMAEQAADHA